MSNYVDFTREKQERIEMYERKMNRVLKSRALMIILAGTLAGAAVGNIAFGIAFAVVFLAWWLSTKFVKEARYVVENQRG